MKAKESRELGAHLATLIDKGQIDNAYALLSPVLAERTPFHSLDLIGEALGATQMESVDVFINHIASQKTMGGWVVIASALREWLHHDINAALTRCREIAILADVWYASDILGERVSGPALVTDFDKALPLLAPWRIDENRWIRRIVGVAVHLWAKRSRGDTALAPQAKRLLVFLEPMFEEKNMDATKGIGWGLKTLGKYYPALVAPWLAKQKVRPHRAIMMQKAMKYFSDEHRALIME